MKYGPWMDGLITQHRSRPHVERLQATGTLVVGGRLLSRYVADVAVAILYTLGYLSWIAIPLAVWVGTP